MLNNLRGCLNKSLLKFRQVIGDKMVGTCSICGMLFYSSSASGYCASCEKAGSGAQTGAQIATGTASNWSAISPRTLSLPISWWPEKPAPPKLEPEEVVVDALVGWRRWDVPMFQNVLLSNNKTIWKPYEALAATCKKQWLTAYDPVRCSGIHCTCGIYAYKEQSQAEHGDNQPTDVTHVWGQVYLWGRVVEHDTGFRAQYAYPKALVNTGGIARQLANEYGIPVITVEPSPNPRPKFDDLQYYSPGMIQTLQQPTAMAQAQANIAPIYLYGNAAAQANAYPPSTSGQDGYFPNGIDASHPDYIGKDQPPGVSCCQAASSRGYICTRGAGHSGKHAAHTSWGSSWGSMIEKWD